MRALLLVIEGGGCGAVPEAPGEPKARRGLMQQALELSPRLELPCLFSLGLWKIVTGDVFDWRSRGTRGRWGTMRRRSPGADGVGALWEMAGVPARPFATLDRIPGELIGAIRAAAGGRDLIGNCPALGRDALDEFAPAQARTGGLIVFLGPDSEVQLAAHESVISPKDLREICRLARKKADPLGVARIIARPFAGSPGAFEFLPGRRDYAICPPRTILNAIAERGFPVHGIGWVRDLFAGSGVTRLTLTSSLREGLGAITAAWGEAYDGFTFATVAERDLLDWAPDPLHFRQTLVELDHWLAGFLGAVEPEDLVILTADRTIDGGDAVQEAPLMILHREQAGPVGARQSFADLAAALARYFQLAPWPMGDPRGL